MKAVATREEQKFKPITLTITMESENDAKWYSRLFCIAKSDLVSGGHMPSNLEDPDPDGDISTMIDDLLEK